ncbi:MAG: GyrI-like domain-containing protein [Actinomycetia bacterium]|nr:GyrI-like domain-containing protein [Actinomycetes bacterium]
MSNPELKTADAQSVAFLQMTGPYAQTPEGYGLLYGWISQHGLVPSGMPHAIYLTMPPETPEETAVWELWAPVLGNPPESEPDDDGIGVKHVAAMRVLSAMHHGPYDTVGPTYEELWAWIGANGYIVTGPPMEIYYSDPARVPPEEYLTEVQIPIARK